MGLVESNVALFTNLMDSKDTLDGYYRVFKAQNDTIEAQSSNPGYHGALYCEHYEALTVSKGCDTKEKLDSVDETELNKMKSVALKSSAGAYLGCVFLVMAGRRYNRVKKVLHHQ